MDVFLSWSGPVRCRVALAPRMAVAENRFVLPRGAVGPNAERREPHHSEIGQAASARDRGSITERASGACPDTHGPGARHKYAFVVTELIVFGSYITDRPDLGDIDIAARWRAQYDDRDEQ